MQNFGPFAVGIAVFVFLAIATVAGIVGDYKKRQIALEPLRAAIERGQQIDPDVIERLMAPERDEPLNPLHLKVGGAGVAILSYLLAQIKAQALYPVLGIGLVAVCVGVGLMIAAGAIARHNRDRVSAGDGTHGTRSA
jgi:hypothetical protein